MFRQTVNKQMLWILNFILFLVRSHVHCHRRRNMCILKSFSQHTNNFISGFEFLSIMAIINYCVYMLLRTQYLCIYLNNKSVSNESSPFLFIYAIRRYVLLIATGLSFIYYVNVYATRIGMNLFVFFFSMQNLSIWSIILEANKYYIFK